VESEAKLLQDTRSGRANSTGRDSESISCLCVARGIAGEQRPQQSAPPWWKFGNEVTEYPLCLTVDDALFRARGGVGEVFRNRIGGYKGIFGLLAQDTQGFSAGSGNEPSGEPMWVLHPVSMFGKP
jgi:hypothetical protein